MEPSEDWGNFAVDLMNEAIWASDKTIRMTRSFYNVWNILSLVTRALIIRMRCNLRNATCTIGCLNFRNNLWEKCDPPCRWFASAEIPMVKAPSRMRMMWATKEGENIDKRTSERWSLGRWTLGELTWRWGEMNEKQEKQARKVKRTTDRFR